MSLLFVSFYFSEDGTYLHDVSTPSSITEWHLTAVSLSPTLGMCVADDTTVTVFQNFFIQLHLPYSVVRLEQTEVIATIFNYDDNLREVRLIQIRDCLFSISAPFTTHTHLKNM